MAISTINGTVATPSQQPTTVPVVTHEVSHYPSGGFAPWAAIRWEDRGIDLYGYPQVDAITLGCYATRGEAEAACEADAVLIDQIESAPTAEYTVEDSIYDVAFGLGYSGTLADCPKGLSDVQVVVWHAGVHQGHMAAIREEMDRLDAIDAEVMLADLDDRHQAAFDRLTDRWESQGREAAAILDGSGWHDSEIAEARQSSGHGFGPDYEPAKGGA